MKLLLNSVFTVQSIQHLKSVDSTTASKTGIGPDHYIPFQFSSISTEP